MLGYWSSHTDHPIPPNGVLPRGKHFFTFPTFSLLWTAWQKTLEWSVPWVLTGQHPSVVLMNLWLECIFQLQLMILIYNYDVKHNF